MKRFITVLLFLYMILIILLLSIAGVSAAEGNATSGEEIKVGDSFFFGAYEQDYDLKDKSLTFTVEPIEWIILAKEDDKALLISKYVIDYYPYNLENKDITWADSDIRKYLNEQFINKCFSETEKAAILKTKLKNQDQGNKEWSTQSGVDTEDYIFLLSYQECERYFKNNQARVSKSTVYALKRGVSSILSPNDHWWTRSPGVKQDQACKVDQSGKYHSDLFGRSNVGLRPALWIDLTANFSQFDYEIYKRVQEAYKNRQYLDVYQIGQSLLYNSCAYNQYMKMYIEAVTRRACLTSDIVMDYRSYVTQNIWTEDDFNQWETYGLINFTDSCYEAAKDCMNQGEYQKAISLFTYIGTYKDSISLIKTCKEKLGTPLYYFKAERVNAGVDTGYSRHDAVTGNDKHFGWHLGHFFASDFSRVMNENNQPIFLKTLGDSITIWFDLEQDIDKLNNNEMLIIGEDTNGYNQNFEIKKTNFGRGFLVIRHTDYQNKVGEPQIYTDFLVAKGTAGANTKIELFEEGDYELELDYELLDKDIKHITHKYDNYKISIRFSIRNGNCMVFPFDAVTGAELQNTSIAKNGFYLDLACSRYLDIDVKRSVVIEGPSGMMEDIRDNHSARDGERYTAEGIYTISVSNRYTGESTIKTIFVGSNELMEEYVSSGLFADRLK